MSEPDGAQQIVNSGGGAGQMIPTSLTTVGICCEDACDQCGAAAAAIEESPGGGYALMGASCGASHGELAQTTITRSLKETYS